MHIENFKPQKLQFLEENTLTKRAKKKHSISLSKRKPPKPFSTLYKKFFLLLGPLEADVGRKGDYRQLILKEKKKCYPTIIINPVPSFYLPSIINGPFSEICVAHSL